MRKMINAGCDVFRVNFSHGKYEEHQERLDTIRAVEKELGEPVAVLADLCGPKIRVGQVKDGVVLNPGQEVQIVGDEVIGDEKQFSISLPELMSAAEVGQMILLDDGKLRLEVIKVDPPKKIVCRVVVGGKLSSHKGVNLPHTKLKLSALTEKDIRDMEWIVGKDFDYVALSFVQKPEDIETLRSHLRRLNSQLQIVAKIEKPQAMACIDSIVQTTDAVMVARGDMGVEMDLPAVPVAQKQITSLAQKHGKPCIVATQMLETMTENPVPTRAEVSDVANAVLDHTDAVMLSGETAVGKYPVETVTMMNRIVDQMQAYHDQTYRPTRVEYAADPTEAAVAAAVREIVAIDDIALVAVFTASGAAARMLAKNRLTTTILGLSHNLSTVRRMKLYYNVCPVLTDLPPHTGDVLELASANAVRLGLAKPGQKIVVVSGRPLGHAGMANTIVVHVIK